MPRGDSVSPNDGAEAALCGFADGVVSRAPSPGPIDKGPPTENKAAAQAGSLNGGKMERVTSHSTLHAYTRLAGTAMPRPERLERHSKFAAGGNRYPILWLPVRSEGMAGGKGEAQGGQQ
jgi:hypothetical protein